MLCKKKESSVFLTFFERIPQKPLRLMFHFDPSLMSMDRFPEKIPITWVKSITKWS